MNLNGIHWLFLNSEPPGRGLDIKEGPESVPFLGVGGAPGPPPCRIEGGQLFKWFP